MEPEDYIANEDNICVILVYNLGDKVVVTEDTIVLGVNFLRKFYTVFDLEKSRIGIYEHRISKKSGFFGEYYFISLILISGFLLLSLIHLQKKHSKIIKKESLNTQQKTKGRMHS